ncbi:MAG: hypothetical protein LBP22_02385 [Deltaproteobacteria bacterium]|jgi:hypothetical protein|nr:hypothetical protein [Deltaproteobacteria bacterium]
MQTLQNFLTRLASSLFSLLQKCLIALSPFARAAKADETDDARAEAERRRAARPGWNGFDPEIRNKFALYFYCDAEDIAAQFEYSELPPELRPRTAAALDSGLPITGRALANLSNLGADYINQIREILGEIPRAEPAISGLCPKLAATMVLLRKVDEIFTLFIEAHTNLSSGLEHEPKRPGDSRKAGQEPGKPRDTKKK